MTSYILIYEYTGTVASTALSCALYHQSQRVSSCGLVCIQMHGARNDNYPAAALQGPGLQFLTVPSLCLCAVQECGKVK